MTTTPDLRSQITDLLHTELSHTYDCTRVWEAWSINTMGPDDFIPVEARVDEIADGIMAILQPAEPEQMEEPAETDITRRMMSIVGEGTDPSYLIELMAVQYPLDVAIEAIQRGIETGRIAIDHLGMVRPGNGSPIA